MVWSHHDAIIPRFQQISQSMACFAENTWSVRFSWRDSLYTLRSDFFSPSVLGEISKCSLFGWLRVLQCCIVSVDHQLRTQTSSMIDFTVAGISTTLCTPENSSYRIGRTDIEISSLPLTFLPSAAFHGRTMLLSSSFHFSIQTPRSL
jgi:hypothetical protein